MTSTDLCFDIKRQPDDTTCGPTCRHAVYRYYGGAIGLPEVICETLQLTGGGTLSVWLTCHALQRGYQTTIFPYNLQIFDPTWSGFPPETIAQRFKRQLDWKDVSGRLCFQGIFTQLGILSHQSDLSGHFPHPHNRIRDQFAQF